MHASSFIALALGATAVPAAAFPKVEARQKACNPFCNFLNLPNILDCPANGGHRLTKAVIANALLTADRSGPPRETSAPNLATSYCNGSNFRGIPLWTTGLPNGVGGAYYAMAPNGTFWLCSTASTAYGSPVRTSCTFKN
ncbi:hypothetical protein GGP41_009212 [Bipolaris sorokiniana]|uniref:Uncharacterized protein n=2 Tax=Cochliobolus sativus TaxID=45130 RepID=A0A8H6DTX3_COCSA|nr:uncharacterized protein COCSADRAFT_102159 [Bipolaris sorokiniana ND90Pr]EMD59346.1 hypothetical protein COCSADRAFT_102159 [Bipolaris sorokiniana ND90Pr]KAF5847907.1 hypothetical protein GGP41_009212 [Bipolaris sorokiniana]